MRFFRSQKVIRILASAVLIVIGAGMMLQGNVVWLLGFGVMGLGLIGVSSAMSLRSDGSSKSSDPYDLKALYDTPAANILTDEPLVEADATYDVAVCHRCGQGVSDKFAICPNCGNRLGY